MAGWEGQGVGRREACVAKRNQGTSQDIYVTGSDRADDEA